METETSRRIGKRIRKLREAAGLTQAELADALGKALSSISQIERGVVLPSVSTIEAIAKAVGQSLDQVFAQEEDVPGNRTGNPGNSAIPRAHLLSPKDRKLVRAMVDRLLDGVDE